MANDSTAFFNWYRRYKVRAVDMNNFQTALVESPRGFNEGLIGSSILQGFSVSPVSGMLVDVSEGIAVGASGYLDVINVDSVINLSAATGALPTRSLIVVRPSPEDANFIPAPTSPFTPVPLNTLQKAKIVLIPGAASGTPEYPSKGVNDAIVCGVYLKPGVTSVDTSMLDFEVREVVGVNSNISQHQIRYDNRLRPYRNSFKSLGIKPSQTVGSEPLAFTYSGRGSPSAFPKNGGAFNENDTFLDFSTGAISGGDTTSSPFSPVIPSGSNSIVAAVTLTRNDTLNVRYGTQGTFSQCKSAIRNQLFAGAGAIPASNGELPICFVIVSSLSGLFSDAQPFDARPFLGSGAGAASYKSEIPSGLVNGSNAVFTLTETPADPESLFFFVEENVLTPADYTLVGNQVTITNSDFIPALGQTVFAKYLRFGSVPVVFALGPNNGGYTTNGSSSVPVVVDNTLGIPTNAAQRELQYVVSNGGAKTVTANPRLTPGIVDGQEKEVVGTSNSNTLTIPDGQGVDQNGPITLNLGSSIMYRWDSERAVWREAARSQR